MCIRTRETSMHRVVSPWLVILVLVACGGADTPLPQESDETEAGEADTMVATSETVRGFLVLGPEVRSLKPCEMDAELWVIPTEDVVSVYDALSGAEYEAVFVEVDATVGPPPASGFGADYSGLLTIRSLLRAEPSTEGVGCSEALETFAFRATGQEPFWHLRIGPDAMLLSTPSVPETIFSAAEATAAADGWSYTSVSEGPESLTIVATLRRETCTDSMSGAVYSWVAEVSIGADDVQGCAWEGGLAPS